MARVRGMGAPTRNVRAPSRAKVSRARTPTVRPALAATRGVRVGLPNSRRAASASSGLASARPTRTINRPKAPGTPSRGLNLRPRADISSRI